MPSRPTHIVWDWNGTLLDDNHAVLAGVNAVCADFGRPPLTMAQWREAYRRPLDRCYEQLLGQPLTEQDWARIDRDYHTAYLRYLDELALAPGVPETLGEWAGGGGTQSLLSMWFHDDLMALVGRMGLLPHFTRVDGLRVSTGGAGKSESLLAHLAAQRLEPERVVVVGDVVDDADAARAAGARCVLVSTGVTSVAALHATGLPVAASVTEALALITAGAAA